MAESKKSTFEVLNVINCNDHTEQKNDLTYLSWAWAWQIAKQNFPDATYTIYENADGLFYHTDGRTCWVKTGVTIGGIEHIEYLPVMDYRNQSIPVSKVTSTDVNKAIQRSLTKAIARHGLGLYIYAGEDLPDAGDDARRDAVNKEIEKAKKPIDAAMLPGGARFLAAVEGHAQGMKAGAKTYRDVWAASVKADAAMLAEFDNAVANYKINHNL
jgi:hypothetical protein